MIELRPHHGMCIGQFAGYGYDREFVENMKHIVHGLETNNPYVRLVCHTDVICGRCPHNIDHGCHSGQEVLKYDMACLHLTGFWENQEIRWLDFKDKVREMVLKEDTIKEVCTDCSWLEICLQAVARTRR
ncbi:DUF1284 domain-containing protein [Parasporobacterium paucivorans]|uniref:DUF1284 domain-containing protein n=1 Tax=Parasporobacterium paucivorans DSM 15970 TaxID=1122934 RepID=A0A1M6K4J1_9FIRM|nr:DUF1284 domain-containing protein [Parasporobacterium paucivorans]SHJ53914.1 hypothetical protein SAMN02745691_02122 [Parasporobacterium paucivorans DSM 15970]